MKRIFFSLTIALSIHYFLFKLLLPCLMNKTEDVALKTQSIMITMSHKSPETVEKPVFTSKKLPPLIKTKVTHTLPAPKQKEQTLKKIYIKKKPVHPLIETPQSKVKPKVASNPLKKVLPKKLPIEIQKPSRPELQHTFTKRDPLLENLKKQKTNENPRTSKKNKKTSDVPIKTIYFTDPEYRNNPSPTYPKKARKKGYEGLVELLVLISVDGRASQIKIKKSTGYNILDKQAIKSIQKWTFNPPINDGQIVDAWVMIPIRFKLY